MLERRHGRLTKLFVVCHIKVEVTISHGTWTLKEPLWARCGGSAALDVPAARPKAVACTILATIATAAGPRVQFYTFSEKQLGFM